MFWVRVVKFHLSFTVFNPKLPECIFYHILTICVELTALLDFVSEGRGFSFIQRTRRSVSASRIPYFWVSEHTNIKYRTNWEEDSKPRLMLDTWTALLTSPSSLHWYDSTRQLSSHFDWTSENLSLTFLRLKSSLKRVSLFRMDRERATSQSCLHTQNYSLPWAKEHKLTLR